MRDQNSAVGDDLGGFALDAFVGRVRIHRALRFDDAYNLLNLRLVGRLIVPQELVVPF